MNPGVLTAKDIAGMIDHSLLRPDMTRDEVIKECEIARKYNVKTVCVRPYDVQLCREQLQGSDVEISVVVGFPHGNSKTVVKFYEAEKAIQDGARELDVVLPLGKVKSGEFDYVTEEVRALVELSRHNGAILKVIFENHYLTDKEIIKCCEICSDLEVDFVKTSTGYAPEGAKIEHVKLMRKSSGPHVSVKAAGGIRTLDEFIGFYQAGATRQGTRSPRAIIEEALRREDI